MAMTTVASSPFLLSKSRPCSCTNYNKRGFPLRVAAVASIPFQQPINVDYLEQEFSGRGVVFKGIGDDCVAKMSLDNGSKAILMLPSGLIASYKASMWHGGTVELLQSSVSQEEEEEANTIRGGVSVALECLSLGLGQEQVSWSPSNWALHDITGNPQDSIQVELISTDSHDMVQVKYIVTLQDDVLISQLMVSNNSDSSSLQLSGCILSHLTVSSPDATYAVGLERSDFFGRLPILTGSAIIPPDCDQKSESQFSQLWKQMTSNGWGPKNGHQTETEQEEEMEEGEEDDNYKNLREQMCRIYTSAPRDFTIIDRGRRNSVVVGRDGFEELYMFSPGSSHEYYGEYAYICIGQSAVLNPIILGPKESWTGGQRLHNPNL
ncbi:protein NDH-DEPENDENT CYCLIC ELECTRON FLOW 5 [Rosa rugosa]|uniref:protein NDH-DEPENDENT CYCLIC ELECTRON FLOW 5 n=1 Tax=Rosa rugosa TaxID=74645 RepID=UPI002B406E14|nr:protein NDH-DEPENDENT CYCLIC ELECTRON FLOW 5 [Rosa rugosa]